jgi:hypothetical protein
MDKIYENEHFLLKKVTLDIHLNEYRLYIHRKNSSNPNDYFVLYLRNNIRNESSEWRFDNIDYEQFYFPKGLTVELLNFLEKVKQNVIFQMEKEIPIPVVQCIQIDDTPFSFEQYHRVLFQLKGKKETFRAFLHYSKEGIWKMGAIDGFSPAMNSWRVYKTKHSLLSEDYIFDQLINYVNQLPAIRTRVLLHGDRRDYHSRFYKEWKNEKMMQKRGIK